MGIVEIYDLSDDLSKLELPFYQYTISAGFPSPADDYIDLRLDLNQLLIKNPSATFFVRVSGDSMINAGILDGDILTVDRSLLPEEGKIVIAAINGECTVKRISYKNNCLFLIPENEAYQPIVITHHDSFDIWGIVTAIVRTI